MSEYKECKQSIVNGIVVTLVLMVACLVANFHYQNTFYASILGAFAVIAAIGLVPYMWKYYKWQRVGVE